MTDDLFRDRFHWCALAAGEGRIGDSAYVKALAYAFYEEGAFAERVPPER